VWGAYGMAILAISLEIISLHRQRLATLTRIRRLMRRHNQDNVHET
jgi:heme exporter protein D